VSKQENETTMAINISERLDQWKIEALDPQRPNFIHANLDEVIQRYEQISLLLTRLRSDTELFSKEDVVSLFGALNSGGRMKKNVAKANPLPELRQALLALLDREGEPKEKIDAASQKIKYAGWAMLGELYGWAYPEDAPLYNSCATKALQYLGYDFDEADYDAFIASHAEFKKRYQAEIGRLRPEIPLNLEIDKLFNVIDKADLKEGSPAVVSTTNETKYWRITLPDDWTIELDNGEKIKVNIWEACLEHGVAAIDFDDNVEDSQVKKFMSIQTGDKIVAFLRNRTIGAIGTATSAWDARLFEERPSDQDYWHGKFWFRISVDWEPVSVQTTELPTKTANMFLGQSVVPLSASDYEAVLVAANPALDPDVFQGFSPEAFRFLKGLAQNNSKEWMHENKNRYMENIREPFRNLFRDVGARLKPALDPHLVPEELEISPRSGKTLANINKQWVIGKEPYNNYYWGAFYRANLTKQTDAQLFVNMDPDHLRVGFYVGQKAQAYNQLRQRVLNNPERFWELIHALGLNDDFSFEAESGGNQRQFFQVSSAADLSKWLAEGNFDLLRRFKENDPIVGKPEFADVVYETLLRVFPVYLWAVAEDWETAVDTFLATLQPQDEEDDPLPEPYDRHDFQRQTYLLPSTVDDLVEMLEDKKQIILYGPPGTGKSYVAQELAKLMTGLADPPADRVDMIQFHPAYSYEDFIEGIRPESIPGAEGTFTVDYPTKPGGFVTFCRNAQKNPGKPHIFIIDEINRGNTARIFGELMLLLEYRQRSVPLPYSKQRFCIPENVYLIGTMNTADRSIALVDFALRRRFHFFYFRADPDLLERWLEHNPVSISYLATLYRALIEEGAIDDPDYAIGPSHFMQPDLTEAKLRSIWRHSIEPYLREYHLEQPKKAERWFWESDKVKQIRAYGS
jgi:uncharacterized protein (DUF2461 family)/MoxR-like ATPase